jgi:hypothetical protein
VLQNIDQTGNELEKLNDIDVRRYIAMSLSKYAKHVLEFEAGDSRPQIVEIETFKILQDRFAELSDKLAD